MAKQNKAGFMKLKYIIIFIFALALSIFLIWQNNNIVITKHNYISSKLPKKFNGFKILHISDLHNKDFYGRLTNIINDINPDIIVITGDLIDRRKTNLDVAKGFIKEIVKIAPTYYVSGNHEQLSNHYIELKEILKNSNVTNVDNRYTTISIEDSEIGLMGIADPAINRKENNNFVGKNPSYMRSSLDKLNKNINSDFNILLSHRPEQFDVYKEFGLDLVFSGHVHGGQIRIPLIGGILAPDQGFFPKYSQGMHTEGSTSMVVSRGLGNSLFPFRVFNRPEVVVVMIFTGFC